MLISQVEKDLVRQSYLNDKLTYNIINHMINNIFNNEVPRFINPCEYIIKNRVLEFYQLYSTALIKQRLSS